MTPRSASRNKTNTIVGSGQAAPVKQTWQWGKQQKRSPAKGLFWELGFASVALLRTEWDARPPARAGQDFRIINMSVPPERVKDTADLFYRANQRKVRRAAGRGPRPVLHAQP